MNLATDDATATATEARVRRAHLLATGAVTALTSLVLLGASLLWSGELPRRLATHFDASGVADDSMPTGVALTFLALVGIGLPVLLIAVFATTQWWRGHQARASAGFLAGLPVGLVTTFVALVHANRGVSGPDEVLLSPWWFLIGLAAAVAVGVLVALIVPRGLPREPEEPATPLALAPGERASWFGRATTGPTVLLLLGGSTLVLAIAALFTGIWWLWLVAALVAVLVAGVMSFVVTVDASGVTWRSALGVPRGHIPLADVTAASVIDVSPADHGGFGLRLTPKTLGLITRSGTALQVEHRGRRLVATVDDAATAAGLLQALVSGRHTPS